jgi:predicted transposase/invertase (TIGR01784 family)
MQKIVTPHDRTFKAAMANQQVAREFFEMHLPDSVKTVIDFDSLTLCQDTFVSNELKLTASDVLYSVNLNGSLGYIYALSEHQRKPEKFMPLRVIQYILAIMDRHLKQYPKEAILPLVVPLVFYHGKKPYPYTTDIKNLIVAPPSLIESILFQPFTLINARELSDKELTKRYWSGLFQLLFKHIDEKNLLGWLTTAMPLFQKIEQEGGSHYIISLIQYLLETGATKQVDSVVNLLKSSLSENTGKKIMTIAEQLIQRGIQEGKLEGEITLLVHLLKRKFGAIPANELKRLQQANADTLLIWADRILDARHIKDVFH